MVHVADSSGLALSDVPVVWTALDGGAFSLADARTDSLGEARAHWRLGPKAGRQRAKVQVGNPRTTPPFALTARAAAGTVAAIGVVSGDAQRGVVGTPLARAVVVRATDSLGNPVSGVPIYLRPRTGKADSVVRTGGDGLASATWTLGTTAGPMRLVARFDSLPDSAVVTATARPGAAKKIYFATAPASGTAGRALPKLVQVVVRDRYGNPVPNATVRFSVAAGTVLPLQGTTDASGRVSTKWTLGPKRGKQIAHRGGEGHRAQGHAHVEARGGAGTEQLTRVTAFCHCEEAPGGADEAISPAGGRDCFGHCAASQ